MAIADISLCLTEVQITQTLNLVASNLTEKVARPDEVEIDQVTKSLTSVNFDAKSWLEQTPAQQPPPVLAAAAAPVAAQEPDDAPVWDSTTVAVVINQISLEVFLGTGQSEDGSSTSLANFAMHHLMTTLALKSNGSMDLKLTLRDITLRDTRIASPHSYKV